MNCNYSIAAGTFIECSVAKIKKTSIPKIKKHTSVLKTKNKSTSVPDRKTLEKPLYLKERKNTSLPNRGNFGEQNLCT